MIVKKSVIKTDPKQIFFFIRLPDSLNQKYTTLSAKLIKEAALENVSSENNDHITLLYLPAEEEKIPRNIRNEVLSEAAEIAGKLKPIKVTVQGWGYFDGAEGDDGSATALVGLLDAPGLEDVHVKLKRAMRRLGFGFEQNHSFIPHATFCYLPQGTRLPNLPILGDKFTIDQFEMTNKEVYEFPLGKVILHK